MLSSLKTDSTGTNSILMIHVAVGSKNPCKINAVRSAFKDTFSSALTHDSIQVEIVISGHDVMSGVRDQPFGDAETKLGAMNRARAAFDAAISKAEKEGTPKPDFGVGLEGGLEIKDEEKEQPNKDLWCMAWMAIIGSTSKTCTLCKSLESTYDSSTINDATPLWGFSKTASFALPHRINQLVLEENMELGHADDVVFNRVNSKQGSGTVGVLSRGMIDRMMYYDHALKLALIPFIWPEHYTNEQR